MHCYAFKECNIHKLKLTVMKVGDLLQLQLMQMFSPIGGTAAGGAKGPGGDMKQTMYLLVVQMISMFFMTLFKQLSTALPTIFNKWKKKYVDKQIENTLSNITTKKETLADVSISLDKKHEQNTVIIIRKWSGSDKMPHLRLQVLERTMLMKAKRLQML